MIHYLQVKKYNSTQGSGLPCVLSDLPGSFIPMPMPPKGTPAGTLTGRREEGVGSTEGI